jgi:hypothetical protein
VWVLVGAAAAKTWWRNLREPADVELWLVGEQARARAQAVVGADAPEEAATGLRAYRAAFPRVDGAVDVTHVVLVRADLR